MKKYKRGQNPTNIKCYNKSKKKKAQRKENKEGKNEEEKSEAKEDGDRRLIGNQNITS